MYSDFPSKRPPPISDDPMVHVYMHYTYKWLLHVSATLVVWPVNFKRPWVLTQEVTVLIESKQATEECKGLKLQAQ